SLHEVTQSDLKAGRWTDAFTSIDAWGSDGRAGEQQLELAKQKARDLITTQLLQQGRAVLGAKPADRVLADVDLALELFEGMNVSDELRTLREQLALWVECRRLACTASTKPEPAYNFGATGIHPADDAQGQATARLPNGTRVWVLARGRGFALVARTQPGEVANWEARAAAAGGWVAADSLKREDTKTWLPSGKALVGERVWLPTGRGDGLYLLGVVQAVDGAMVKIKKEGDGQDELVSRNDLRSGILAPGTKVLAFCRDTLKPTQARMQEVTRPDSRTPLAKVTCLNDDGTDANTHEELLGALRARAAWLPVRKP
ncbi:MAG: hypothetical protein MUF54_24525, partial [Polyangiaceae bacterium]|nr:hypothetical protein [Polyangiaceae bacterium]